MIVRYPRLCSPFLQACCRTTSKPLPEPDAPAAVFCEGLFDAYVLRIRCKPFLCRRFTADVLDGRLQQLIAPLCDSSNGWLADDVGLEADPLRLSATGGVNTLASKACKHIAWQRNDRHITIRADGGAANDSSVWCLSQCHR